MLGTEHGVRTDTVYTYGAGRISSEMWNQEDRTGYYLYDPRGSVAGITDTKGQVMATYRYSASGEMIYGAPEYENVYAYNGESYNPNIRSQYLRARYYNVATAAFLTEDSYLGEIMRPLTLNRYGYCLGNPVNYVDPSGESAREPIQAVMESARQINGAGSAVNQTRLSFALGILGLPNMSLEQLSRVEAEVSEWQENLTAGYPTIYNFGALEAVEAAARAALEKNTKEKENYQTFLEIMSRAANKKKYMDKCEGQVNSFSERGKKLLKDIELPTDPGTSYEYLLVREQGEVVAIYPYYVGTDGGITFGFGY